MNKEGSRLKKTGMNPDDLPMISRDRHLSDERKSKYILNQARYGSLFYLALPWLGWEHIQKDPYIRWLGPTVIGLSLIRFFWLLKKVPGKSKLNLLGIYTYMAILAVLASFMAARMVWIIQDPTRILGTTMTMAALIGGLMMTLASAPQVGAILGLAMITPFGAVLGASQAQGSGIMYILCMAWYCWSLILMRSVYINYLKIQASEKTVQFQEERLKQFINNLPGYVSWFDNNMCYLDANEKLGELNEVPVSEIVGRKLGFRNQPSKMIDRIYQFKNSNLNQEVFDDQIEVNGQKKYLLTTLLRYRLSNNEDQISVLSLDMTALKEKELEVESKHRYLIAQEKFAAMGEMAGGIAHEINNPMAVICGKIRYLQRRNQNKELTPELLDHNLHLMDQTAQRIVKIVRSLRALIRNGALEKMESISLRELLEPLIEICRARLDQLGIPLFIQYQEEAPIHLLCGVVELGQVIMNLVVNAGQAIETKEERWVRMEVESHPQNISIKIIDSGTGLSSEVRKKLFQPFFTTKAPGSGTGLGLSISRELMQKQNGNLYYLDGAKNTTFVVEIQRTEIPEAAKAS